MSYIFCECGARMNNEGEAKLHVENVHEAPRLRAEIERLREENAMLTEGRKSADIAVLKLAQEVAVQREEIERLRCVIHTLHQTSDGAAVIGDDWLQPTVSRAAWEKFCDLAREIAREGR